MSENNIKAGTIARTIILVVALFNQVMTATGHNLINISNDDINTFVSLAFTIGAALTAWWKNNSFTKAARAGDKTMRRLKEVQNEQSDYGG